MKTIVSQVQKANRPIRAVQFGEGNFLRAFVDHMLDIAGEKGVFDGSVAVIKPTSRGNLDKFHQQNCLYTVILRGREKGEVVNEARIVTCIDRAVSPYEHPECLQELAQIDSLEYIIFE